MLLTILASSRLRAGDGHTQGTQVAILDPSVQLDCMVPYNVGQAIPRWPPGRQEFPKEYNWREHVRILCLIWYVDSIK
jgi:hypothetical protein